MKTRKEGRRNVVRDPEILQSITFYTQGTVIKIYHVTNILPTADISMHYKTAFKCQTFTSLSVAYFVRCCAHLEGKGTVQENWGWLRSKNKVIVIEHKWVVLWNRLPFTV